MKEESTRFYTRVDDRLLKSTKWPWQLSTTNKSVYRRCLLKYRHWSHSIIDCEIEFFFNKKGTEYPDGFIKRHIITAKYLTRIFGAEKIWVTIPDYPDDYEPGYIPNNVEKTLKNIEKYHEIEGVNWLYPLQAKYLDLESFKHSCEIVKEYLPKQVAIGTVCKTRNQEFIIKCFRIARRHFPNTWIHAFGPTLRVLPKIINLMNSWDSTAYFTSRKPGEFMCKNRQERFEYFKAYLDRVKEISSIYDLAPLSSFWAEESSIMTRDETHDN